MLDIQRVRRGCGGASRVVFERGTAEGSPAADMAIVRFEVVEARAGRVRRAGSFRASNRHVLKHLTHGGRALGPRIFGIIHSRWGDAWDNSFYLRGSGRDVKVPTVMHSGVSVVHRKTFMMFCGEIKELDS